MAIEEAALESARLRFRPILMTAFAFILGVVPLMKASGAGAGAQNVMGTAVFWGMLVATALGVFLIPGNYAFVELLGRKKKAGRPKRHRRARAVPRGRALRWHADCLARRRRSAPLAAGCALGPELRAPAACHGPRAWREIPVAEARASPTRRGGSSSTTRSSRS